LVTRPHPVKICIAGNYDVLLERPPSLAESTLRDIDFNFYCLEDSRVEISGLKFHGSPEILASLIGPLMRIAASKLKDIGI
jgi:hypothetical protein